MKCPQCGRPLKKVEVKAAGAQTKAVSYQCAQRDYFEFEPASSKKVIPELRESPLKIRQKVIKLSQERLGIYVKNHQLKLVAWFLSSSKLHRSFESTAKSDFAFVIRSPHAYPELKQGDCACGLLTFQCPHRKKLGPQKMGGSLCFSS